MDEDQKIKAEAIRAGVVHDDTTYLKRISDDIAAMRKQFTELHSYIAKAESKIPEDFRRFIMAYHDMYHIREAYQSLGLTVPKHVDRGIELLDDAFKNVVADLEKPGGHFYKARQDIVKRGGHRYDHNTPLLAADAKEQEDEIKSQGGTGVEGG